MVASWRNTVEKSKQIIFYGVRGGGTLKEHLGKWKQKFFYGVGDMVAPWRNTLDKSKQKADQCRHITTCVDGSRWKSMNF